MRTGARRGILTAIVAAFGACALLAASMLRAPAAGGDPAFLPARFDPPIIEEAHPEDPLEATVHLKDGRTITGLLVERSDAKVTLQISGIETSFPMAMVDRIEILRAVEERYQELRAGIDDSDTERLLMLAEWLRARQRYELALEELDAIVAREPSNQRARDLRTVTYQQLLLIRNARPRTGEPAAAPERPAPRRPRFPVLTPEQVNIIRVYEIDLADPPRMNIPRDVIDRLVQGYSGHPLMPATREGKAALYREPPARLLELMFKLQARELYGGVRVLENPAALKKFRDEVHRAWLLNSCASNRCHGGESAGRLYLATEGPNTDATVYTNFLILERYRVGPERTPLIDFDEPARSILLQMGLPRADAAPPHPDVPDAKGWKPVFKSREDPKFMAGVEWIKSMYRPRPDYPIDYTPPEPAPRSAAEPALMAAPVPPAPR